MTQIIPSRGGGGGVGLYKYKGTVDYYEDLPSSGMKVGDVYNIVNAFTKDGEYYPAGTNVAWTGTDWDALGGSIDLSDYQKKLVEGDGIDLDQDTNEISVESAVISGAELGATALQPNDNVSELVNDAGYLVSSDLKQSDWGQSDSSAIDYIKNKPTIGNGTLTVSRNGVQINTFSANQTSNSCVDISVPTKTSDIENDSGYIDKTVSNLDNYTLSSNLCAVATSGKYCDLSGTPTIGNATLTIQKNGTDVNTFTANATTNVTANITVPTTVAELADSSNYALKSSLCTVATSGKYCDLTGTPALCAVATSGKYCDLSGTPALCTVATTGSYNDLSDTPALCAVATSGLYCDLSGTPTIPTDNSQLANGCGYAFDADLCTVAKTGKYCDLTGLPTIPTDNCQLSNGCGYAKASSLCTVATTGCYNDLTGKPTIGSGVLTIQKNGTCVDDFSANATTNKIINITVPTDNCQLGNSCGYTTCTGTVVASDLTPYAKSADLCTVATTGKYCDLTGIPTIPTVIDALNSTCTTEALSAKQGCVLNSKIATLEARGRFLSNWNATTGLPVSFPEATPYTYRTGDYFDVTVVGATNYKPSGSSYTGAASTTVETDALAVGDTYVYDGTNWLLQLNHNITTSFSSISGSPYDNTCLSSALGDKANTSSLCAVATSGKYCDLTGTPTIPTDNCQLANGCGYITSSALSGYQLTCNMVCNLSGADNSHYPTAKAVADALSGAGQGDMLKSVYDPNNIGANAFDYCNFINTPTIPTDNSQLANGCGYITGITCTNVTTALGYTPYNSTNPNGYTTCTGTLTASNISDAAYSSSWNGVTTVAPSKNAVYDKIESVVSSIPTDNNQLSNGCGYTTCTGTVVAGDLAPYAKTCDLATVATSGKYCDLTGTPSLATVATSGKYCDLTGQPTIGAATLTIQKNGTTVNTFGANATSNVTANITVPTDTGDLTNGAGFITGITSGDVTSALGYTPYNSANPAGYTTCTGTLTASNISDTAYGSGWNGVTTVAPSKNAVYDKISTMCVVPSGGTEGQVLTKTSSGCAWADASGGDGGYYADILVVGGGGGGGANYGGGGGGGAVKECKRFGIKDLANTITIGSGGNGGVYQGTYIGCDGGMSCFGNKILSGGGGGGACYGGVGRNGCCGGGGGGGGGACNTGLFGGCGDNGNDGGPGYSVSYTYFGGGGGGAAGAGGLWEDIAGVTYGGAGYKRGFDGVDKWYGVGGGGGMYSGASICRNGGGKGGIGTNTGTTCACYGAGGGGGGSKNGGAGYQGVVIVRYPSDGSYGFTCATGGTKTSATIDGIAYCIHTFTSNGTFTIVS